MIGISTLVILLLFIGLALAYLKFEHHGRRVKVIVIIIVLTLIYFSISGVLSSERVDLTSPRGVVNAVYIYFGWLGHAATSLWDIGVDTVGLVGNAIKVNSTEEKQQRR
jgi:hypothetical protein